MDINFLIQIGGIFFLFLTMLVGIIIYLITNPEKIEVMASLYWRLIAFLKLENEKKYVSTNIQSIIAGKRKNPELNEMLPYGINVKWIEEDESSAELRDNKVLVMMKPYKNQSKNVASIISLYVPKTMLPISRKYVSEEVIRSMDYVIGKNLLSSNASALEIYIQDHDVSGEDLLKHVVDQVEEIHKTGHLSRILVPTYQKLSSFHPNEPSDEVKEESHEFLDHLHEFETNFSPNRTGVFNGEVLKIAVVPIARQETIEAVGVIAHIGFIHDQIEEDITDFFIVATGSNIERAKQVKESVEAYYNLTLISEHIYEGFFRGWKRKMICIHMCV